VGQRGNGTKARRTMSAIALSPINERGVRSWSGWGETWRPAAVMRSQCLDDTGEHLANLEGGQEEGRLAMAKR
jgi:hypothetical protein